MELEMQYAGLKQSSEKAIGIKNSLFIVVAHL